MSKSIHDHSSLTVAAPSDQPIHHLPHVMYYSIIFVETTHKKLDWEHIDVLSAIRRDFLATGQKQRPGYRIRFTVPTGNNSFVSPQPDEGGR